MEIRGSSGGGRGPAALYSYPGTIGFIDGRQVVGSQLMEPKRVDPLATGMTYLEDFPVSIAEPKGKPVKCQKIARKPRLEL